MEKGRTPRVATLRFDPSLSFFPLSSARSFVSRFLGASPAKKKV